jgi:hypothetical protein
MIFQQWTMPPFRVTLRKLIQSGDIYELITGSDRFGHEVDGFMQLIQGKEEALKRFEAEKQRIMVKVAKIAMRHE